MDNNLEAFFANSARVKAEVEADPELKQRIRSIFQTGEITDFGTDAHYTQIQPLRLGFKRRGNQGIGELAMTADLYAPDIPSSSFAVLVEGTAPSRGDNMVAYLVQDFGDVYDLRSDDPRFSQPDIVSILNQISAKGYNFREPECAFGYTGQGVVLHDLDKKAMSFQQASEVNKGIMHGEGEFARLAAIYERFKQPEYRLVL